MELIGGRKTSFARLGKLASTKLFVAMAFVILIAVGAVFFFSKNSSDKSASINCDHLTKDVTRLMENGDNVHARPKLEKYIKTCAQTNDKVANTLYIARLAISAYESGDKGVAKGYSQEALKSASKLSLTEQFKIPNFSSLTRDMRDISEGRYNGLGFVE
jgi:hypothetical protein